MAVNLAAPPVDPVQQTALVNRQFSRALIGDFTLDHERAQHRHKILLTRNMTRVLAFHEKGRARQAASSIRASSRLSGLHLGQSPLKESSGPSGGLLDAASRQGNPRDSNAEAEAAADQDHDTSKPEMETMSKDCLKVKAQIDMSDGAKRRSLRRQLVNQHQDADAQLNLDLLNIRKKLNFKETAGDIDDRPRKRFKRDSIPCHCHLTVWDNRSPARELKDPLVRKSELCQVITTRSEDERFTADIKLDKPFVLHPNELRVTVQDHRGSTLALGDKYFLEIKIIPAKENVQWPPIPFLGKSEGDQTNGLGQLAAEKLQGSLVMRYLHLPQSPPPDVPWSVFFLKDGKTYRSKYGLEVRSSWTKGPPQEDAKDDRAEETLAEWAVDDDNLPFGRRQSTRSKPETDQPDFSPSTQAKISYNFDAMGAREAKEFRRATIKGFRCPVCPNQSFGELKQLQHHLMTSHSKYKFAVEKETRDPSTNHITTLSFKVSAASTVKPRTMDREKRSHEDTFVWQAPAENFNIDAFIEGDPRWLPDHPKKRAMANTASTSLVPDPLATWRQKYGGFLPAELVPEFRPPARRKHPAIRLNTMTEEKAVSYTSVSHRQRHLSEDPQSETDDEMDNEPFVQKSVEMLDVTAEKNEWSNEDRILRSRWNKARFAERLSHPRYLSDGLIRFIRAEKEWLCNGGVKVKLALVGFLSDLIAQRVINEDVVRDVWFTLHNTESSSDTVMKDADDDGGSNSDQGADSAPPQPPASASSIHFLTTKPVLDTSQPHDQRVKHLLSLPDYSCGYCTEFIADIETRGLHCSDPKCEASNVWYHARCARWKVRDKLNWKCPLCVEKLAGEGLAK